MGPEFTIERHDTASGPVLVFTGEVDAAAIEASQSTLASIIDAASEDVQLDLAAVTFLSLAMVEVLLEAGHVMATVGRRLRVVAISPVAARSVEVAEVVFDQIDGGDVLLMPPSTRDAAPSDPVVTRLDRDVPNARPPSAIPDVESAAAVSITSVEADGQVEIAVAGELDIVGAERLQAALQTASDRAVDIVVDLAAVSFMDASGVHCLLDAERTLSGRARRLRLAEPSRVVRRLLTLCGLDDHFQVDAPGAAGPDAATPITERAASNPRDEPAQERLRTALSDLAATLLTANSLREDLDRLVTFACQQLPTCTAASVALLLDGTPSTVSVTERLAIELDLAQYATDDGPCLAALSGQPVRVDVLAADDRFQHFATAITNYSVNSVLSVPILYDDSVVGTLNFYAVQTNGFDDAAQVTALLTSTQAAHAIARSNAVHTAQHLRDRLQAIYDEAILTARAQGVLVAQQRCSDEQARLLLERAAATTAESLTVVAERVLAAARNQSPSQ